MVTPVSDPEAVKKMNLGCFQMILLDVMMPGTDGFSLCGEIRDRVDSVSYTHLDVYKRQACNRVRLTSEGYLKTCLQYDSGTDLRVLLRNGASKEEIKEAIQRAVQEKPRAHQFTEKQNGHGERHMMSQIGG